VRELHERLNHASDAQMISLLDSSCLMDTPLTPKDIRVSREINGPCNSCMVGKFVNPPSRPSTSTPTSHPGELLHMDIAFFQEGPSFNRPYLVVIDDFSGFCFCLRLLSESYRVLRFFSIVEECVVILLFLLVFFLLSSSSFLSSSSSPSSSPAAGVVILGEEVVSFRLVGSADV
jgi:hypothetical protein